MIEEKRKEIIRTAKKSLGQNFLIDAGIVDNIAGQLKYLDNIVEIGPGVATLTEAVLRRNPVALMSIEKDERLTDLLDDVAAKYPAFSYVNMDALKVDWRKLDFTIPGSGVASPGMTEIGSVNCQEDDKKKYSLISNLPYNISTLLTVKFVYHYQKFNELVLMFQKEVGVRIVAESGSEYGRLSVMAQSVFNVKKVISLKPGAFYPAPKVESVVLYFEPNGRNLSVEQLKKLDLITKIAFENRRKKAITGLKAVIPNAEQKFSEIGINLNARAEEISVEQFLKLSEVI